MHAIARFLLNAIRRIAVLLCAAGLVAGINAAAQSFPARPIRLIVTTTVGSSNEVLARIVGQKMGESLGQSFVIDARPGASGVIGTELAANSPPDGHTLLLVSQTVFATRAATSRKLPFDPDKAFIQLTGIAWVSSVVTVQTSGPATVAELVQVARSRPERFNFGSAGSGSPAHLAGELFNVLAGTRIVHVPYKGTAVAVTDLIAGQIQLLITSPLVVMPHVNSGRIKAIATTAAQRDPLLPQLPTMAETLPGYEITQWWGLAAVAGTPRAIVDTLYRAAIAAINSPDVKEKFTQQHATAMPMTPAEFSAFILRERARTADLMKRAHVVLDE